MLHYIHLLTPCTPYILTLIYSLMILLLMHHRPPPDFPPACSWFRVPLANLLISACQREEGQRREGAAPQLEAQVLRLARPAPFPPCQPFQSMVFPLSIPINSSKPQCPDFLLHCETSRRTPRLPTALPREQTCKVHLSSPPPRHPPTPPPVHTRSKQPTPLHHATGLQETS